MGTYYHLINETKKESVHFDHHIKEGPMRFNATVHFALINYMMDNQGDKMFIEPDMGGESVSYGDEYTDIDLWLYPLGSKAVNSDVDRTREALIKTITCGCCDDKKDPS